MGKDTYLALGPSRADLAAIGLLTSSSRSFLFLPLAGTAGTSWQRESLKRFLNTFLMMFPLIPQRKFINYDFFRFKKYKKRLEQTRSFFY
jgi:hypothetical protein